MSQGCRLSIVPLFMIVLALGGCDYLSLAPEDKINAAIPVSDDVVRSKAALVVLTSPQEAKQIENEYKTRLKVRALTCSKGYMPTWYKTKNDVSRNIPDRACFVNADAELARWLKLRRLGYITAMPPLRPLPSAAPAFIVGEGTIMNATFADQAGVVLLELDKSIQILDVQTGDTIYRESKGSGFPHAGVLSPNGRLFLTGSEGKVKICESESGAVLVELPWTRMMDFHWLDARRAVYSPYQNESKGKVFLLDFASGKETPLPWLHGPVEKVMPVSESKGQFVVATQRALSRVELSGDEAGLKLVQEKPNRAEDSGRPRLLGISDVTPDGRYYFHGGRELTLTSLESLNQEKIPFHPYSIGSVMSTPDPDRILISGFMIGMAFTAKPPAFYYSLSNRKLYFIDDRGLMSTRFVSAAPLKKIGVVADSKITLLDDLPLGTTQVFTERPGDAIRDSMYRRLEGSSVSRGSAYPAQGSPAPPPLESLARNARIEAIGVYEGYSETSGRSHDRNGRSVEVRVGRTSSPIILVLSSYEPVRWRVVTESGARIAAVLLSSHHASTVDGAGSARVVNLGGQYAYKQGTPQYGILDGEVYRYTGKRIDFFQGRYQGKEFSVGE